MSLASDQVYERVVTVNAVLSVRSELVHLGVSSDHPSSSEGGETVLQEVDGTYGVDD